MARGRMLSTETSEDMLFNEFSTDTMLIFLMTLPHLDRDGLITGEPELIAGRVLPLRRDLHDLVEPAIQEWIENGMAIRYQTERNGRVLFFRNFRKHNANMPYGKEAPSKYPAPPDYVRGENGLIPEDIDEARRLYAVFSPQSKYAQEIAAYHAESTPATDAATPEPPAQPAPAAHRRQVVPTADPHPTAAEPTPQPLHADAKPAPAGVQTSSGVGPEFVRSSSGPAPELLPIEDQDQDYDQVEDQEKVQEQDHPRAAAAAEPMTTTTAAAAAADSCTTVFSRKENATERPEPARISPRPQVASRPASPRGDAPAATARAPEITRPPEPDSADTPDEDPVTAAMRTAAACLVHENNIAWDDAESYIDALNPHLLTYLLEWLWRFGCETEWAGHIQRPSGFIIEMMRSGKRPGLGPHRRQKLQAYIAEFEPEFPY